MVSLYGTGILPPPQARLKLFLLTPVQVFSQGFLEENRLKKIH